MKVLPIASPSGTEYHALSLQQELATFRMHLVQKSIYPGGRECAERFLFLSKDQITAWRDQLNCLLTYINRDLEPKFRRKPL